MTEHELNNSIKAGEAKVVKPDDQHQIPDIQQPDDLTKMIPIFDILRRPKYHLTDPPTFIPKTLLAQIQFYDDGADQRLYLYINNTWRYVALT